MAKKSKVPQKPAAPTPSPHPDTILLDILQSVLDRKHYTGKVWIGHSKSNKGLLIGETLHDFPQFGSIREAIRDFGDTHGIGDQDS